MQKLIVANYKMNGSKDFYASAFKKINNTKVKDTEIVLCPPFVYLPIFKSKNKNIKLGAQDISLCVNNKSTGQISPLMLKEHNVDYAIIGHSEQRTLGLTNEDVSNKVKICVDNKIIPIICVGELTKRSAVDSFTKQIESALTLIKGGEIVFAYEPVWAIGTGEIPTIKKIDQAVTLIKNICLKNNLDARILYGGSVNKDNFRELMNSKVDGLLLGGVSLNLIDFTEIVRGVDNE